MVVGLRHTTGNVVFFLVAHLHHLATVSREQWLRIGGPLKDFPGHLFTHCDHNSLISPGIDGIRSDPTETPSIVKSREVELDTLQEGDLLDCWRNIFHGRKGLSRAGLLRLAPWGPAHNEMCTVLPLRPGR